MKLDTKNMLCLRNIVRKKVNEIILDNPRLKSGDHKYLFYIGLMREKKVENAKMRAKTYLEDINLKIKENQKIVTDEVISALLAIRLSGSEEKEVLGYLNDFLEKRVDIVYSPLSDINNIFFLSPCYDLLSEELKARIRSLLDERFRDKNIPIFEFILISGSKLRVNKGMSKADELITRLLSYSIEEISFKDLAYVEWFYQTILKKFQRYEDRQRLYTFVQNLRKEYLNDVIQSIPFSPLSQQYEESEVPSLNVVELTLLYETTSYFGDDILVLTADEINEKFKTEEKGLFLGTYKWQNLFFWMTCSVLSLLCLIFRYTPLISVLFIIFSAFLFGARYLIARNKINQIGSFWTNKILCHFLFILWLIFLLLLIPLEKLLSQWNSELIKFPMSIVISLLLDSIFKIRDAFFAINTSKLKYTQIMQKSSPGKE